MNPRDWAFFIADLDKYLKQEAAPTGRHECHHPSIPSITGAKPASPPPPSGVSKQPTNGA